LSQIDIVPYILFIVDAQVADGRFRVRDRDRAMTKIGA